MWKKNKNIFPKNNIFFNFFNSLHFPDILQNKYGIISSYFQRTKIFNGNMLFILTKYHIENKTNLNIWYHCYVLFYFWKKFS